MTDFCTVAQVKEFAGIQTANSDALIARLITSASAFIRNWCGSNITTSAAAEYRNGDGGARMMLTARPVTAVQSLTIDGLTISPGSPTVAGYLFDSRGLYLTGGLVFTRGGQNVAVAYTAGLSTVPSDIEGACIELVATRFREKDRIGLASQALQGQSVSFTAKEAPESVLSVLRQYRNVVPL